MGNCPFKHEDDVDSGLHLDGIAVELGYDAVMTPASMSADEIKKLLKLTPHPCEGGSFIQTWKSEEVIPQAALPTRVVSAGRRPI